MAVRIYGGKYFGNMGSEDTRYPRETSVKKKLPKYGVEKRSFSNTRWEALAFVRLEVFGSLLIMSLLPPQRTRHSHVPIASLLLFYPSFLAKENWVQYNGSSWYFIKVKYMQRQRGWKGCLYPRPSFTTSEQKHVFSASIQTNVNIGFSPAATSGNNR